MYFFTSDEHVGHAKCIEYSHRPFATVEEMNETIISNFNSVVDVNDITIHAGDFCWYKKESAQALIKRLKGNHIFLKGSHDHWLPDSAPFMWRKMIDGQFIVVCHYAMRTWERSHYGAWMVYGHSHTRLEGIGKSFDIGVDTAYGNHKKFYPYSFEEIREIMKDRPENFNMVKKDKTE